MAPTGMISEVQTSSRRSRAASPPVRKSIGEADGDIIVNAVNDGAKESTDNNVTVVTAQEPVKTMYASTASQFVSELRRRCMSAMNPCLTLVGSRHGIVLFLLLASLAVGTAAFVLRGGIDGVWFEIPEHFETGLKVVTAISPRVLLSVLVATMLVGLLLCVAVKTRASKAVSEASDAAAGKTKAA